MNDTILTISGRSNSGKSTLEHHLVEQYTEYFDKVVSHTSRPIRVNEKNGIDYYFVNDEVFNNIEMIEDVVFSGSLYGTSRYEIERIFTRGKIPIIVITPEGVEQIAQQCKDNEWKLVSVFIDSSDVLLMERFMRRFHLDMQSHSPNQNILDTYLTRINRIFGEEKTWKEYFNWDIIFDEFNAETELVTIEHTLKILNIDVSINSRKSVVI